MENEKEKELYKIAEQLTDTELDNLIKDAMRRQGYKTFINYEGEEEVL